MNRHPHHITCEICEGTGRYQLDYPAINEVCEDCDGTGRTINPHVDMRHLRDLLAAEGIDAELYMSGGNCATIGVGEQRPNSDYPDDPDYTDNAFNVGVGSYHDGVAHREELSAGISDSAWHDLTAPNTYNVECGDDSAEAFAARIITAYNAYAAAGFPATPPLPTPTYHATYPVGQRVTFTRDIHRYPCAIITAGETGTVSEISSDVYAVTLDTIHEGLAEWDNAVHVAINGHDVDDTDALAAIS